jgi:hypothetical protein
MNLQFVNPALLWGLLAASLPLVVHLLFRRRARPLAFPAIEFILRARRQTERRLRLKRILLFTARTLVLAAIAAAIARPKLESPAAAAAAPRGPSAVAIILDASGSMSYRLGGRTLFERAKADAADALAALTPEEPATLVLCGPVPAPPEPPGFDKAALRRVLDAAEPTAAFADLTACVGVAAQALSGSDAQAAMGKRIVVATDLTRAAWRLDQPPPMVRGPAGPVRPEVVVLDAARGAALPNAGITAVDAQPDPSVGPRGYRLAVELSNSGGEPLRDLALQLRVGAGGDAKTALRAFADVPAGASAKKSIAHAFSQGGPTPVDLSIPADALPIDDARALVLDVPREVRALVVDGAPSPIKLRDEAWFVEAALASPASPVRPRLIDGEALAAEDLSGYDVVFLLNVRAPGGKAAELRRLVERGGGLFIALGDQIDPDAYGNELGDLLPLPLHVVKTAVERGAAGAEARAAHVAEVAWDHPALAVFQGDAREGLLGARFYRYVLTRPAGRKGQGGEGPRVLAAFDDGAPALVEARRGAGRVLLFTSSADLEWNDWAIRTSFLPSMQRFAALLAGALDERREPPTVVGAERRIPLGEGRRLAALVGPDGRERRGALLKAEGLVEGRAEATVRPRLPGLWQVKVADRTGERLDPKLAFAAWADPRESDTRRLAEGELTAWLGGAKVARVEGEGGKLPGGPAFPLWSILLMLGLVAFVTEGLLVAT